MLNNVADKQCRPRSDCSSEQSDRGLFSLLNQICPKIYSKCDNIKSVAFNVTEL